MGQIIQVLLYHRICDENEKTESRFVVSKDTFRRQMAFLADHGFYTPRLSDLLTGSRSSSRNGKRPIVITFDDGYLDNYQNALPVLREFGFSATIFVVPDFSRRANWWDTQGQLGNIELLQSHHIKSMSDSGIEFGAHSYSHSSLPALDDRRLETELVKSKVTIEELLHQPLAVIAYPYGDVDMRVKSAAQRAGFRCAFAAHTGPLRFYSDLFEIRRIPMCNRSSSVYLMFKFSGLDLLFRWALWRLKLLVGFKSAFHSDPSSK